MATDQRMNHCKRCQKATPHISQSTSHFLHLFLTILNFGVSLFSVTLLGRLVVVLWVWPVVWFAMTLWHRAQSQCTACGKYRLAALPALAFTVVFILPVLAWTMLTITDPQQLVAIKVGDQKVDGRTPSETHACNRCLDVVIVGTPAVPLWADRPLRSAGRFTSSCAME